MADYVHGPRSTAAARAALGRLIGHAWDGHAPGRGECCFTIPVDRDHDADCVLSDVITERDALRAQVAALTAERDAAREALRALVASLPRCTDCDLPATHEAEVGTYCTHFDPLCREHARAYDARQSANGYVRRARRTDVGAALDALGEGGAT